jgi:hypothetical protein
MPLPVTLLLKKRRELCCCWRAHRFDESSLAHPIRLVGGLKERGSKVGVVLEWGFNKGLQEVSGKTGDGRVRARIK